IQPKEETPRRTPWWLTLLRLTLATLVILAAAGPLWNPPVETATAKSPLALLIDDGFPAAGTWDARMRRADDLSARAETDKGGLAPAHALTGTENTAGALTVKVLRSAGGGTEVGIVRGMDIKGLPLGETTFSFQSNETETDAELTIPVEIRNEIARIEITAEH